MADEYEWCVMHHRYPNEPHRGPLSEAEAREWIWSALEDGFKPGVFYLARRPVGGWERVE